MECSNVCGTISVATGARNITYYDSVLDRLESTLTIVTLREFSQLLFKAEADGPLTKLAKPSGGNTRGVGARLFKGAWEKCPKWSADVRDLRKK
jgi:hypothetical protein